MAIGKRDVGLFAAALVAFLLLFVGLPAAPAGAQVNPNADLSITKSGPDTVEPGTVFEYVIMVSNAQNAQDATGVVVEDELPRGVTLVESEPAICVPTDPDGDGRENVTCTLAGPLASGDSVTITLRVRPGPNVLGTITNRATVSSLQEPDSPVPSNEVTTRVIPDLEINKLDDPDPVTSPEQLLLYTLRVQNEGESFVSGVAVTDDLPLSQVDFVTLDSNDFDCQINGGLIQCNALRAMGPGEVFTVEVVVEPEVAGTIQNLGAVFVQGVRGPIDTDVEETLVQERAVPDDDNDDNDNDDNDNNDNGETTGSGSLHYQYRDVTIIIDRETTIDRQLPKTGGAAGPAPLVMVIGGLLMLAGAVAARRWV